VLLTGFDYLAILRARKGGTYTFVGRVAVEGMMLGQE